MLFKIVSYMVDDGLPAKVPERPVLLEVESQVEAYELARVFLGLETSRDVVLARFAGAIPETARVIHNKLSFSEMYGLDDPGLATAL